MEKEKKPYLVGATPILHDKKRFEPNDVIELTEEDAAGLAGHVTPAPAAADESKATKKGGKE